MRALSPKVLREIRNHLELISNGYEDTSRWVAAIDHALAPKRSAAPARKRTAAKKRARALTTKQVREAVMARAGGRCEHCGLIADAHQPLEMDHFLGGSSRRSSNTVQRTWMLTADCHRLKTRNRPSAEYWRGFWVAHCVRHGYPIEPAARVREGV